ncbi:MAG: universal stress protein [Thermomicrobia bacterium]|nr:universal stress protein [Thermomicrobia bacterium]
MKILVGIGGAGVELLLARAAERIAPGAEWIVVHITSDETFGPMEGARFGMLGRGRRMDDALRRVETTAQQSAEAILAAADGWLTDRGVSHTTVMQQGNPEREIIRLAAERQVDLIVIDAGIVGNTPHGPGKHPLGRIARFVVDHALCDVLLVRRFADPQTDWLPPHPPPPKPYGPHARHDP